MRTTATDQNALSPILATAPARFRAFALPLLAAALASAAGTLGGCISINGGGGNSDINKVSGREFDQIVESNKLLSIGMSKREALEVYPGEVLTLRSSAVVGDSLVEEWQVIANKRGSNLSFSRWLYFVEGRLATFGDDRQPGWKSSPELIGDWRRAALGE